MSLPPGLATRVRKHSRKESSDNCVILEPSVRGATRGGQLTRKPPKRLRRSPAKAPDDTSRNGWFSSLSKGVKLLVAAVITVGAVASAIGAIVALWPDPPEPISELGAEIVSVTVDQPAVTLDEYRATQVTESDEGEKSGAPASNRAREAFLAAVTLPQQSPVDTAPATGAKPTTTPAARAHREGEGNPADQGLSASSASAW